ncbi:AMP-binding protein [Oceanivirga miroungae]|uniref:Acinetobactin biosynthesis protein n=1 Tax=Oceanivirga miroungae TaxID=1130046 RepID=A0A6I8M7X4_9FUSO|nr:AMP-binding protein [Oceanivirga miroungae]VWL85600.1 acinetobactin biosynthesis protein [Oceanivirga miroungae]
MFLKKSDKLAIVDFDGKHITYNEMVDSIKYLSEKIYEKINKEDKVLIIAENRLEWIYSFFAIWDRYATPVPVDALSTKEEIDYFLTESGASVVIVTNKTKNLVEDKNIVKYNLDEIKIGVINNDRNPNHPENDDLALMLYTCGTTGKPKGVMLSFNNLENEVRGIKSLGFTFDDEQTLAILPFHHIFPLVSTGLYFYHHEQMYSVVLLEKLTSSEIFRCLNENRITGLSAVPRVYKLFYKPIKDKIMSSFITRTMYKLAKRVNNIKFSRFIFKKVHDKFGGKLRTMVSGGGKADIEMIEFFNTLGFLYCEGYGLSETSPVVAGSGRTNYKAGTIGKAMTGATIRVLNEELQVKSPVVMLGYHNNIEKTKEVMTEDGYFKTGDRAIVDEDGFITILGRLNEMIVLSNGKNVNPLKLEDKILEDSNNLILEIGIFAQNDKLNAIIVPNRKYIVENKIGNIKTHIKDIIQIYNASAHNYEKILDYRIVENELPKTRVGKLKRFTFKDLFNNAENKTEIIKEPELKEYKLLKEYIKNSKGLENVNPNYSFEVELGMDSLDLVEFKNFLEETFSITLEDDIFIENNNLMLLSEYVSKKEKAFNKVNNKKIEDLIKEAKVKEVKHSKILIFITSILVHLISLIYFRVSIKGKDKIKDKVTIFIANHESFIDAPLMSLAIPLGIRYKTNFLGLKKYFSSGIMKLVSKSLNVVTIDIEKDIKNSIEEVSGLIKNNENVFIFPEGGRTKDGKLDEFKPLFAVLAKELNVDIRCIGISGAYEAYSRFDKFPRPKKIVVEVLDEITTKDKTVSEIVSECKKVFEKYKGE